MKKNFCPRLFIILSLFFLYTPIIVLIAMGFNQSRYNSLPFHFTLEWYEKMFANTKLLTATRNSLLLALITSIVCMILGTLFILGQQTLSANKKQLTRSFAMMPMSIPWLIIGLSLLLMIRSVDMTRNMLFVLTGHIVISLPYTLLVLEARINALDPNLEDMSASLGASALTTFKKVTLPTIAPAIIAGGFLSFMISFDNFPVSYFLMPTGISTLPIEIQSSIKFGFTPEINAISTLIIGISLICLLIVCLIMKRSLVNILGGK